MTAEPRFGDTRDPEYAARKWLTDCTADEASTVLDLLDELDQLRAVVATYRPVVEDPGICRCGHPERKNYTHRALSPCIKH